jgi:hypothetical protein
VSVLADRSFVFIHAIEGQHHNLCSLLVFLPLAPPFLLNSLHLILHHVLGKALFEPKEAPILAGGVFDAVLATVHVE